MLPNISPMVVVKKSIPFLLLLLLVWLALSGCTPNVRDAWNLANSPEDTIVLVKSDLKALAIVARNAYDRGDLTVAETNKIANELQQGHDALAVAVQALEAGDRVTVDRKIDAAQLVLTLVRKLLTDKGVL